MLVRGLVGEGLLVLKGSVGTRNLGDASALADTSREQRVKDIEIGMLINKSFI